MKRYDIHRLSEKRDAGGELVRQGEVLECSLSSEELTHRLQEEVTPLRVIEHDFPFPSIEDIR
jgi:hypothetical protein